MNYYGTKDERRQRRNSLFFRFGGLLYVGLVGILLICCGLALAFGNYRLSMIFFFIVLIMLVCAKLIVRFFH